MQGELILGLDPGVVTGYGVVSVSDAGAIRVVDYGIVPQCKAGQAELLRAIVYCLDRGALAISRVAWEGAIKSHGIPTQFESQEARGVIRYWAAEHEYAGGEYHPSTVKATLKAKTKKDVATAILRGLDLPHLPRTIDHIPDALAVACVDAIKGCGAANPFV